MKNIIGLLITVVAVAVVSCTEPKEDTFSPGGEITMADIDKYVSVKAELDPATGKPTNTIVMNSDGLKALSRFDYKQGIINGTGGTVQVYNKGTHTITFTAKCANGKELTKDFSVSVEVLKNVDVWINLCGENGTKTWTWDHTRIPRSTAENWTPEAGVNYFPAGPHFPENPIIQQYPAAGRYATVFGMGIWRVHTYPQLYQEIKEGEDEFYSTTLYPMPAGYINPEWPVTSLTETVYPNEGVIVSAGNEVTKMATMTFDITKGVPFSFKKNRLDDSSVEGTFRLDPAGSEQKYDVPGINPETNKRWYDEVWAVGQLVLAQPSGVTGVSVLNGGYNLTYNIVKLTADEMILAVRGPGTWAPTADDPPVYPVALQINDNMRCFLWVFKPYTE